MYIDRFGIYWEDEDVKKLPPYKIRELELQETAFKVEELFD